MLSHRGHRDFGNVKMTSKEKAKKLYEIADALEEWGKYNEKVTNAAEWGTPEAKQIIRKAMTLLVDNLVLLNECKNKYGCHSPLQQCFVGIEQVASLLETKDLGDYRGWTRDFTERHLWGGEKRSLADECIRYANEVGKETKQDTKSEREGMIEPKPPEILQKTLWILKYGRKYWGLILLAIFLLLIWCIFVWPKFDFFSKFYHPTKKEALNDYGRTTNQELKAKKKEIEASTETKRPHTIKEAQSKQLQVQEGKAYSDPTLGLIIYVKTVGVIDYIAYLDLVLPGHKPITGERVTPGKSWDFQTADTQYKLVVIETNWREKSVLFELSQIVYKQAEK